MAKKRDDSQQRIVEKDKKEKRKEELVRLKAVDGLHMKPKSSNDIPSYMSPT